MSAKADTIYECTNVGACTLGTRDEPGRFTGGISAEQVALVTGKPLDHLVEDDDYGDGFCPNCGRKGRPLKAAAK